MLANAFTEYGNNNKILIFASGVSNSVENNESAFKREFNLLEKTIQDNPDKNLVYFSTTSIMDESLQKSLYVIHKKKIEKYIQDTCKYFNIFRLSQVLGNAGNPNNLVNNFAHQMIKNETINVYTGAKRNLVDIKLIKYVVNKILNKPSMLNKIVNVASPYNYNILEIIQELEKVLALKANTILIEKGFLIEINISDIEEILIDYNMPSKNKYLYSILQDYINV